MNRAGTVKKRTPPRPPDKFYRARVVSIVDDVVTVKLDGGDKAVNALGADFGVRIFVSGPYWKTAATVIADQGGGELVLGLRDIDLDTRIVDLRPIGRWVAR